MEDPTLEGVVETSFVRKEYYVEPPIKGSAPEVWQAWLEADKQAASAAKRAFTKSQKHAELPEHLQARVVSKVGGVYRQSAMVGFVGDGETSRIEAAVDADQDKRTVMSPWAQVGGRGKSTSQRAGSSKRARAKAARKARKGQN